MTSALDWTWIVGNHDPGFADHCGGQIVEEAVIDGIVLRHEAEVGEPQARAHRAISTPSFASTFAVATSRGAASCMARTKLILPAFGSLTGGPDAHHPEILRSVGGRRSRAGARVGPAAALPDRGLVAPP